MILFRILRFLIDLLMRFFRSQEEVIEEPVVEAPVEEVTEVPDEPVWVQPEPLEPAPVEPVKARQAIMPLGEREEITIIDLAAELVPPMVNRTVSRKVIAAIIEYSILPRRLQNPVSWLVAIYAGFKHGMEHTYFPSRNLAPYLDENKDFITVYYNNSNDDIKTYSKLDRGMKSHLSTNGLKVVMPKDVHELYNMKAKFQGNYVYPFEHVPDIGQSSPVNPNTRKLWVDSWYCGLAQFEAYPKGFGRMTGMLHSGIDMNLPNDEDDGALVYPIADGVVTNAVNQKNGLGLTVRVKIPHGNSYIYARYAHLKEVYVKAGLEVSREQPIGAIGGTTGIKSAQFESHLHFDIQKENCNVYAKTYYKDVQEVLSKFYPIKEFFPNG